MSSFRAGVESYVDTFWDVPCDDNVVHSIDYVGLKHAKLAELARAGENPANWRPVFLRNNTYDTGTPQCPAGCAAEELYLVRNALTRGVLKGIQYDQALVAAGDKKLVHDWYGLLDCAHFVSRSLSKGGVSVDTGYVPTLVSTLHGRSDTKTLCDRAPMDRAKNVVGLGVMKTGDVIAYAHKDKKYYHSAIYMHPDKIACHTMSRSPGFPGLDDAWFLNPTEYLYTLIHFTVDDAPPNGLIAAPLEGWWEVTWRGAKYYYFYKRTGRVSYTRTRPANTRHPISAPAAEGYWFGKTGRDYAICWTSTGSVETFTLDAAGAHARGRWNDAEDLVAAKLP